VVLTEYEVAWREAERISQTVSILIVHIKIRNAAAPPTLAGWRFGDA
jgi:hypothetical protein